MQPLQNFCIPVVQPLCLCAVEIPEAEIRQNTCLLRRMGKRRAALSDTQRNLPPHSPQSCAG